MNGAELSAGETVANVGAVLTPDAAELVAPDGDVIALDISVDVLEGLRARTAAANVSYLVGQPDVLPLPDASVDAVVALSVPLSAEAAREFARVLRAGGRVSLGERERAWNEDPMEQAFVDAGFADVAAELGDEHVFLTARKP